MQPNTGQSRPLLLVVEDDADVREAIVGSLIDVTAEIITAENGKDGLAKITSLSPQAVLTDINMPFMNGLEMLREVRKLGLETPVVVLSAFGDRNNTVEALRLGAMDFLNKPFDIDQLNKVVNVAIDLGLQMKSFELEWQKYLEAHPELGGTDHNLVNGKKEIMKLRFLSHVKKAS